MIPEPNTIYDGDCRDVMASWPDACVSAIVTDPPYGLEFMGKAWDSFSQGGGSGWRPGQLSDTQNLPDGNVYKEKGFGSLPIYRGMTTTQRQTFYEFNLAWAREAFRIAKPGAHLIAFGGTRTVHRMVCAIEDAGWEIRDMLIWGYHSGFPKSRNIGKDIDRILGAEREVVGTVKAPGMAKTNVEQGEQERSKLEFDVLSPESITEEAKAWDGWGTALKPAYEPIVMARKPLIGTVAANVQQYGAGALNIDGCRIGFQSDADERETKDKNRHADFGTISGNHVYGDYSTTPSRNYSAPGRWPANVVLTATEWCSLRDDIPRPIRDLIADFYEAEGAGVAAPAGDGPASRPSGRVGSRERSVTVPRDLIPSGWMGYFAFSHQSAIFDGDVPGVVGGGRAGGGTATRGGSRNDAFGSAGLSMGAGGEVGFGDEGTASRFYLIPKASRADREPVSGGAKRAFGFSGGAAAARRGEEYLSEGGMNRVTLRANHHPTVKPTELMRHLVRLVTPPAGIVLDPFLGSGTTAVAADAEGRPWVGIEKEPEYAEIARARLNGNQRGLGL